MISLNNDASSLTSVTKLKTDDSLRKKISVTLAILGKSKFCITSLLFCGEDGGIG